MKIILERGYYGGNGFKPNNSGNVVAISKDSSAEGKYVPDISISPTNLPDEILMIVYKIVNDDIGNNPVVI